MTNEKDLLVQALGTDEPPLTLDFNAIEAKGRARRSAVATAAVVSGVGVITGGVVLGLGSAGNPGVPTEREIAYCYRTADITSDSPNQHIPVGIGGLGGRGDVTADIMQICADSWRSNVYGFQPPEADHIPPLVACVLTDDAVNATAGAIGVFPGDSGTCAALGLARVTPWTGG